MTTRHRLALGCFAAILTLASAASGEELFVWKEGKRVGWRQGSDRFKACDGKVYLIADGKIEATELRCPTRTPPVTFIGVIMDVDAPGQVVKLRDQTGKQHDIFVPAKAEAASNISLDKLKVGDKVTVQGPIFGHASSITKMSNP